MSQVEVYASSILENSLSERDLATLIRIFTRYKATDQQHHLLGKDVPYHEPHRCAEDGLRHIHLYDENDKLRWRTSATSDFHLVYTNGFWHPNRYLLITILDPPAHERAWNMTLMTHFCDIAADFRDLN